MFKQMKLTGERVLVSGTDTVGTENSTVLDASQWYEIQALQAHNEAHSEFDSAVEDFFAPLTEAIDKLESAGVKQVDPISYVTIHEGSEGTPGTDAVTLKLTADSIVLRLLEQGDTDRLIWVGDKLEVLEVLPGTQPADQGGKHRKDPHAEG